MASVLCKINNALRILAVVFLGSTGLITISAENPQGNILILNSYHFGFTWSDSIVQGILGSLPPQTQISVEYMDTKRFAYESMAPLVLNQLSNKYRQNMPDGIITSDDNALRFMLEYHEDLFPDVPLIFCGVNQEPPELSSHRDHLTGLFEHNDHLDTLKTALRLLPRTKRIYFITDNTTSGKIQSKALHQIAEKQLGSIEAVFLNQDGQINLKRIESNLETAPDDSIVYFSDFNLDDQSRQIDFRSVLPELTRNFSIPFFSSFDSYLELGIVGGKINSGYYQGEYAANLLLQVLKGIPPDNIDLHSENPNKYIFNVKELERFGISQQDLPAGSILINSETSIFQQALHWLLPIIIAALFFFLLSFALLISNYKRRIAEKNLAREQMLFKSMLDSTPDHIYFKDKESRFLKINSALAEFLNISDPEAAVGKRTEELLPSDRATINIKIEKEILSTGEPAINHEECIGQVNNIPRWMSNTKIPLRNEVGSIIGTFGISRDISLRKEALKKLEESLEEKETLLREVHHRVKNNLAMIISLISLQASLTEDSIVAGFYTTLQNRIYSISLVHERIYHSTNLSGIYLKEYIQELVESIIAAIGSRFPDISLEIKIDQIALPLEKAIPLGIILNELITNVLKHGFSTGKSNILSIVAASDSKTISVTVRDNGAGFPESHNPASPESLGFRLIQALTAQLNGSFTWGTEGGAWSSLTFPLV